MDAPLIRATANEVRSLIARLMIPETISSQIGSVTLAPHQSDAVSRINSALEEFRGAFLCDAVGSGKTYIGLAIVARMKKPVVIAPAGLRRMWKDAASAAGLRLNIITIESLSRRCPPLDDCDCLIIDEAHHFRNRATIRYRCLSRLARNRRVLLMTATPVHNSRKDFENLGAIFLGSRVHHLSALEMARLVIRRDKSQVRIDIPAIRPTEWLEVRGDDDTVATLLSLPPPALLRDAGEANALLSHGLIRQWASSEAALTSALKRRVAQAAALESALQAGEYPTRRAIRSWILGDDAIQLALPDLFADTELQECESMLRIIRAHSAALRELVRARRTRHALDDERSSHLAKLARLHPGTRIVAFASYEATVLALFERLLHSQRVACLTSRGARVAGGRISREDAVTQFDPSSRHVKSAEQIDLLLTTDLLSEGVNLQNAAVVVHLDLPWTAARLEQRVGRVARLGSRASSIAVYGFKPPASAERVLRAAALVHSKWQAAASLIGATEDPGLISGEWNTSPTVPETSERTRAILNGWLGASATKPEVPLVAAAAAASSGFLAVVESGSTRFLICDANGITTEPARICAVAENAAGGDVLLDNRTRDDALSRIAGWIDTTRAATDAGIGSASFLTNRRRVFARINALAARSAPHARFAQKGRIERARAVAAMTLGSEDERALDNLDLITDLEFGGGTFDEAAIAHTGGEYKLRALLLLVAASPGVTH